MINRRNFLLGSASLVCAPYIKYDHLMKLYIPSINIFIPVYKNLTATDILERYALYGISPIKLANIHKRLHYD